MLISMIEFQGMGESMKVLTSSKAIRYALHDLQPLKVAVAYVGRDWDSFVSAERLNEIVLSPTIGTNPKAVEKIMNKLGHENVYFLDNLHAKFYIGDGAALLGSCNLSANGIGENGLLEAAVEIRSDDVLRLLSEQFDRYKLDAKQLYPTLDLKMDRLRELLAMNNRRESYEPVERVEVEPPSIASYQSKLDRIHIMGLTGPDGDPVKESIAKQTPELIGTTFDNAFTEWVQVEAPDDVRPGDWLLCWWCTGKRLPDKRVPAWWVYAHCVVNDGMKSKTWSKFVGEVSGDYRRRPPEPFKLDDAAQAAIRQVLQPDKFPELFPDRNWRRDMAAADKVTPVFLDTVKNLVANP